MNIQPKSAKIYSSLVLNVYDMWVLGISNKYAWKCSTGKTLLPFFRKFATQNHLDVGAGTGFYPAKALQSGSLTLLDSNPNCLDAAALRCRHLNVSKVCHDIFKPLPMGNKFASISAFYLLHCLEGPMHEKEVVISNLKHKLTNSGVFFGATILGDSIGHNLFGRKLMTIYNRKGIFGNSYDTAEELQKILEKNFATVFVEIVGKVALFVAKEPI